MVTSLARTPRHGKLRTIHSRLGHHRSYVVRYAMSVRTAAHSAASGKGSIGIMIGHGSMILFCGSLCNARVAATSCSEVVSESIAAKEMATVRQVQSAAVF